MKKRQRKKNFKKFVKIVSEMVPIKQLAIDLATFENRPITKTEEDGFVIDWRGEVESARKLGIQIERE